MEKNIEKIKISLRDKKYVDVPFDSEVHTLLQNQVVANTNYKRSSGQATENLDWVENLHRKWISEIVDLKDFEYCYFVNGVTDAMHIWRIIETRPWQKFEGDYQYMDLIGFESIVCCDVLGQYMKNGRSAIPAVIDNANLLYISLPSAADGNHFDISNQGIGDTPAIVDCSYVGTTNIKKIQLPQNTEQIFFGFSKGFGVVGQRLGLVYSKEPHPMLQRLKNLECWNYTGVETIRLLITNFSVDYMWHKNIKKQLEICNRLDLMPSDCYFLATSRDSFYKDARRMRWNDTARLCISDLFEGSYD